MSYCSVNGVCSNTKDIRCGVAQGSCLSPLLFLIYINYLPFSLKKAKVTMYADDANISYSSSRLEDVNQILNSELSHLKKWLPGNKLSLNILKTQALVVGSQPKIKKIVDKTVDHPQFFIGLSSRKLLGLRCNVKLFADDTSLFTVVEDSNTAASDMNHDLDLISQWAHTWRMSFNPDPQKQAVELTFSRKKIEIDHPVILLNDIPVKKVTEHKHLGIILDSKLSFSAHIKSAISKARKGIGLLKYLSKYLPRHTLSELYKLYVRPHLDYGDVFYHIPGKVCEFSQNIILSNLMEKMESVQYSAALAVTGTWRGTSREKLYPEPGWESLSSRRWSRRLTLFYKIINSVSVSVFILFKFSTYNLS